MGSIFVLSPNLCSRTDSDGTTILDVHNNKIYSVIGVGSRVWDKLTADPDGVASDAILRELSAEFNDIPRGRIERDVELFFSNLQKAGLVRPGGGTAPNRFRRSLLDMAGTGFILVSRMTIGLLLKLRFRALAVLLALATIDFTLETAGFRGLYHAVRYWPVRCNAAPGVTEQEICSAVDNATTWYPKEVLCLPRSAVITWLLRQQGIAAQMVIGCRKMPFQAHAWVELNDEVISDRKQVHEVYKVLDRL